MSNAQSGKRIGIMGGSFNPIHYGHLMLAEQIRTTYELDKIIFVPVGIAPHKDEDLMDNRFDRFNMTKLAIDSNPFFEVCDFEIQKASVSYSIDTVLYLKELLKPEDTLYFITGADAIILLDTWARREDLIKHVTFVGATRPGIDMQYFEERINVLKKQFGAKIEVCSIPALAISSTDIRERIAAGKSIKYLIPESVEQYIFKKGLYRE